MVFVSEWYGLLKLALVPLMKCTCEMYAPIRHATSAKTAPLCVKISNNMNKHTIQSDWLQAFRSVAAHLSISAASKELNLDKSQVSKRVALLEHKLGATLFARSTRKVALTPAGLAYLDHAQRVLAELDAGEELLRSLRTDLSGRIRLTAPVSWGQRVLAPCLPDFLRQHPGIEIDLILSDQKMDLARDNIDLALRWTAKPSAGLSSTPIAPISWHLAASYGYLAANGTPKTPADLTKHQCFCYWRESADDRWEFVDRTTEQRHSVQAQGRFHANNPEAVLAAAIQSLGIALLPDYLCEEAFEQQTLIRLLPAYQPLTRFGSHMHAQAPAERALLPRNRALLGFLQTALALPARAA